MRGAARPHPGGPFAALDEAGAAMALTMLVAEAGRGTGRFPTATWSTCLDAASLDAGLREAWEAAPDGGRRDVMTTVAELAARAGVDPAGFDLIPELAGETDDEDVAAVQQAAWYARALLELAAEELATPGRDPELSLLPDAPWMPATGPTGILAMSTVCDSTEPETAKLAAAVALSAAAQQAGGTQ